MRRILLAGAVVLSAFVGAAIYSSVDSVTGSDSASYREARRQIVTAHLRQFQGGYLLLAGDSHIESWFAPSLCGLHVVNAGMSGATAASYAAFFETLTLPRRPRAIVVTLGTNDARTKKARDPDRAVARYRDTIERLLRRAAERADHVIVTAVPPLDPDRAAGFSPKIARRFSLALHEICERQGCHFVDPFTAEVQLFDGVHLDDYAGTYAGLWRRTCPLIAG